MRTLEFIETDRLLLKRLDLTDKEAFFAYRTKPEIYVYQLWKPSNIEEVEAFIIRNLATIPNTQNIWLQLGIHLKNGPLIGDIGIHFLEDAEQTEIGYTLSPDHQGHGYAHEAVKAIVDFLFYTYKKHRITASVDHENHRSINLLKKLGFRQEAHFKKSLLIHGEWCDDVIFAILEEEWNALR